MALTNVYGRDPEPADIFTGLELWSLVGGVDALADASDSTYVQAGQQWTGSGETLTVTGPNTSVQLDDTPIDLAAGDTFDRMVVHLRFQRTLDTRAGVGPPHFLMTFYNDLGFYGAVLGSAVPLVEDLATNDYTFDWTPEDNGFEFGWPDGLFGNGPVHWHIGQGADLAGGPGSGDTEHRIYRAWMEVTWTPAGVCLQNAERSACVRIKNPDGSWADLSLVGA